MPKSLEVADQNEQSPLIKAQVFQLMSDYVLKESPAHALKVGEGQIGPHFKGHQDIDLGSRGKIVKSFIGFQVRVDLAH